MWAPGVTAAMVGIEAMEVSLSTIMKAAMSEGMSQFVCIVYSNALALFLLFPSSSLFYRGRARPQLTVSIISKIFLMGVVCVCIQIFFSTGVKYSSPTLCTAISDLTPAFTFLLAIISRTEKLDLRLQSSQAKLVGTIVSAAGALTMTLYKGQPITIIPSQSGSLTLLSLPSNWIIGGILCAAGALCLSLLYVLQAWVLRDYPAELMITTITCIFVTVISAIVTLVVENDPYVWLLRADVELIAVGCSAVFAVSLRSLVHTWAIRKKGPLFTAMFKPAGMIIATFLGVSFLGDVFYVGSLIGGTVIAIGFYTVLWGKAQEEKMGEYEDEGNPNFDSSSPKVPLLQNKSVDV